MIFNINIYYFYNGYSYKQSSVFWLVKWITYGLSSRKLTATPSGKLSGGQAVSLREDEPITIHLTSRKQGIKIYNNRKLDKKNPANHKS